MTQYYLKTSAIVDETLIQRDRMLPPEAWGEVSVPVGRAVNANTIVAQGEVPQDIRLFDVAKIFNIKPSQTEKLAELIDVEAGDRIEQGQFLINIKSGRHRRRAPVAPDDGSVLRVENGRIFVQINPRPIQVAARIPGKVTKLIENRGVQIETVGALLQCAWGTGHFIYSSFAFEPDSGLASLAKRDSRLESARGRVYILQRPLTAQDIQTALEVRLDGLVATSMPAHLKEAALRVKFPIILTDGFGEQKGTERIFAILRQHAGQRQAAFDGYLPALWQNDRPEIIIPLTTNREVIPPPISVEARPGLRVRLQRPPYQNMLGVIQNLPESPQTLENGLRTLVARVKLDTGNEITVALNNLELLGITK
jgi:hypothetical protein